MSVRLLKNVSSGLIAQAWTGILGLAVLPVFARGLGPERYGLLALNLALINFAAVADLGVGRAASKYLAEDFERKESFRTQNFISTAMTVTLVTGILGTLLLAVFAPLLVRHAFRVPAGMQREAEIAFWITSAGLLAVLLRILLDGVLVGHHRIAALNLGNMAASTLRLGLSVSAILHGESLLTVLGVNVGVAYLHVLGLWIYTARYFANSVKLTAGWHPDIARQLLKLGIPITASWIIANIVFLYADRFLIAAFLPLALTGYYTMAFDITSRQSYVSNSIAQAFFPVFSGQAAANPGDLERSYLQATKAVAVGSTGLAMVLVVFAKPLLADWIGPEYAANATSTLMLLAVASLLSCYVSIPSAAIIAGAGQPAVCMKVFSIAVAIHIIASLVLLRFWGIAGVAAAFALALLFVLGSLLVWVSRNLVEVSVACVLRQCFAGQWISAVTLGAICWYLVEPRLHSLLAVAVAFAGAYAVYLGLCTAVAYR